jgi:hypothetical protein
MGAADIAAAVAGFATTSVAVGGGTTFSVQGGVDVATGNTKMYLGDTLTKSGLKTTITRTNLPDVLPQGTFYDNGGTSYTYNQYITFGAGTAEFGTSGGDLADPKLYINTQTSTSTPIFNITVVFNKILNLSSADVRGQPITLFGKDYTIGSDSVYDGTGTKLILFGGGGSTQVIAEGQEVTMSAAGVDHKVKVIGVSSTTQAVVSIDGVTQTVTKGQTKTIGGISVYTKDIYFFQKEAQVSQVELSLGASKLILENANPVKTGQTEDTVDGTLVTLTGSTTGSQGISKLDISVTAKDSSHDSIASDALFTDPVFGAIKLAFGGLNLGTTDQITIDNAGTTQASLKFTDYRGNEKTIYWAYAAASLPFNAQLNDSSTRAYHVLENETVFKNDYVLLAPSQESEFGHIFQYTTASSIGSTGAYMELKDVISGDTTRIYLNDPGQATATFYVDGQPYYVKNVTSSAQTFAFSWGAGAGVGVAGNRTVFPLIKAKNGEYVTLLKNQSISNNGYTGLYYQFPGDTAYYNVSNLTTSVAVGRFTYMLAPGASSSVIYAINQTSGGTGAVSLTAAPAVLIYEEKGKDLTSDSDRQDGIIVTVADGGGASVDMTVQTPVLTAATSYSGTQTTDNSVTEYYDRYGAHVKYDTDGQGLVVVDYPDDQATVMAGIGSNPTFSTAAGTTGTVKQAVQIKNPVTKLDSEVSTTSLNSDLILLGGPCANTLVAQLLSSDNITCNSWPYTTGLIKEVASAFGSTHKALIVAGTQGTDTRALAAKVMQGTLSFST